MNGQVKTLWLLECKDGNLGRLFTFYAEDDQQAEETVREHLALHPQLVYVSLIDLARES